MENDCLRLTFDSHTGALVSLYNVHSDVEHLDSAKAAQQPLWAFEYMPGYPEASNLPTEVSFKKKGKDCIQIQWTHPSGESGPDVRATVCFKKDRPSLAEWYLELDGIDGLGIQSVRFPIINGILPQNEQDELAVATWTGTLIENPWSYATIEKPLSMSRGPGYMSAQVSALYNPETDGIYWGTEDPDSWYKESAFEIRPDNAQVSFVHFLRMDVDNSSYSTPYPTVIGTFEGDWIDAANLYKSWGLKQKWCNDSRLRSGKVPEWVQNTAVWVWNRGRSGNVLPEAVALQKSLGLPVSVFWHWWHNCSYDDGFPEYLPPREGREPFIEAVAKAKKEGVHCINYMNSFQWGDSTPSWKEKHADLWCLRKADGSTITKTYNIFSGKSLTNMCPWTEFWRRTYADMCDTLVNVYGTSGVYLDQACQSKACYSPSHGHPIGGGNTWVKGHRQMIDDIWQVITPSEGEAPTLAGEGACESWMGHLDLGLTLEAANDRLAPALYDKIPFFEAIYHPYQICYGNVSMLVSPPYDEKWPEEFRPSDAETLLPDDFDKQFMMEQAKTFVWGVQPCIANFHEYLLEKKPKAMAFAFDLIKTRYQALDYLLYGDFVRCPQFPSYTEEIPICRQTIYVKSGSRLSRTSRTVSTLYSSAWKASDGSLGIALANIADQARDFDFVLDPKQYGLPSAGEVISLNGAGAPRVTQAYNGKTSIHVHIPERSTQVLSIR